MQQELLCVLLVYTCKTLTCAMHGTILVQNDCLPLQMVEMLMESADGFKAYAAAEDSHKLHLDCTVEYQALHAKDADLRSVAKRVLSQLRPLTKQ